MNFALLLSELKILFFCVSCFVYLNYNKQLRQMTYLICNCELPIYNKKKFNNKKFK